MTFLLFRDRTLTGDLPSGRAITTILIKFCLQVGNRTRTLACVCHVTSVRLCGVKAALHKTRGRRRTIILAGGVIGSGGGGGV